MEKKNISDNTFKVWQGFQSYFNLHAFNPPWSTIHNYELEDFLRWPFTIMCLGIDATIEKI